MNRLFSLFIIIQLALPFSFFLPQTAQATTFDQNYILSDDQLLDYDSMTKREIQAFLEEKGGFLADYTTEDHEGVERSASEIIYRVSQDVGVNPKFLLVLLQKEQSLITDTNPSDRQLDWATGYAVCDSCSKDDPAIQRWKGFGKQVNSAALQFVEGYLQDIRKYGFTSGSFGPDEESTLADGTVIIPKNATTAGMYAYTPHLHGNRLFHSIWQSWFGNTAQETDIATQEPNRHLTGTLLKATNAPEVYYIDHGVKRYIANWTAFISRFNPNHIIEVDSSVLEDFPTGREIALPNYSLLKDQSSTYYLLVDDILRPFDSAQTFRTIGFVEDEVVNVTNDDVANFAIGEAITSKTSYPTGTIMQLSTGLTFLIKDGRRHVVLDQAVLDARFPNRSVKQVTPSELSQYLEGPALLFPDGYLIKSPEHEVVYLISDGKRSPIPSEEVFYSHGLNFKNVVTVSKTTVELHKLGQTLELLSD